MLSFYDSHAHLNDSAFDADRDAVITGGGSGDAIGAVRGVLCAASDMESSRASLQLAARVPTVFAAVGVHPQEAAGMAERDIDTLRALATGGEQSAAGVEDADNKANANNTGGTPCTTEAAATGGKADAGGTPCPNGAEQPFVRPVAVGEIGLDYHYEDLCPREAQRHWFARQLELANELNLPVLVHDRDAHADTLELLTIYRPRGVVHCFSGSVETMREVLALDMYIGLGGVVTFHNARHAAEVAAAVPLNRLLLETDAPYLAPEPHRGHRNEPAYIAYTAQKIADLRGVDAETVIRAANENFERLFLNKFR
ncbi:MAG: TatD family hydrolase [Oscillospiraceae bacterium]|nr:TatD family hydrolase [Oscillospiraceae bacterium]